MMTDYDFSRVIVFGGTTEGRLIADRLALRGGLLYVCVATKYGETFLTDSERVRIGRLDKMQMVDFFSAEKPSLILDATHPYAVEVSKNIREACFATGYPLLRIGRGREIIEEANLYRFHTLEEMVTWLNTEEGVVFSTLGVKEVKGLSKVTDYRNRVYVRVLPVESSLKMCEAAGFTKEHVIAAMGPFTYEQNKGMMEDLSADILLTKDSGKAGGFAEKIRAAMDCRMKIAVLTRPEEESAEDTYGLEEMMTLLEKSEQENRNGNRTERIS